MLTTTQIKECVSIELVSGVLFSTLKSETIDLQLAKAAVKYRMKHFGDKDYPVVLNLKSIKHITKAARYYLVSHEGINKVKSCAIIVNSDTIKVTAIFFLQVNTPLIPTKLFTSERHAHTMAC